MKYTAKDIENWETHTYSEDIGKMVSLIDNRREYREEYL